MSSEQPEKPMFPWQRAMTDPNLSSSETVSKESVVSETSPQEITNESRTSTNTSQSNQRLRPNSSHVSLMQLYTNNNGSSSTLLPAQQQQNTVSNVEFNNVRSSFDNPDDYYDAANNNVSSSASLYRTMSSSTTLSRMGKDNKFTRFISRTADFMKKTPGEYQASSNNQPNLSINTSVNRDTLDLQLNSLSEIPSESASSPILEKLSGSTALSKLKKPDNLSIQTSLLPSSKELKSPLARTSKEVERIASFGGLPIGDKHLSTSGNSSQQTKSKHKHLHHYHLLRSRKDPTKSSSSSNSKLAINQGGETLYSFRPSTVNESMSVNDLKKTISELEKLSVNNAAMSGDKDAIADEAWNIVCNLVLPIFRCERLKTPIEEINKLVYLHLSLRANQSSSFFQALTQTTQSTGPSSIVPPLSSGGIPTGQNNTGRMSEPHISEPFTPLGMPTPTFGSTFGSSPTGSSLNTLSPVGTGSTGAIDELKDFLKSGMAILINQIQINETTKEVSLNREQSQLLKKNSTTTTLNSNNNNSSSSNSSSPFKNTAGIQGMKILASDQNFQKVCSLLWEFFYNDLFFYLQGIFLPIDNHSLLDSPSNSSLSSLTTSPINDFPPHVSHHSHHGIYPHQQSPGSTTPKMLNSSKQTPSTANGTATLKQTTNLSTPASTSASSLSVRKLILISFRDNIVIPLYELNRQSVDEKEQSRTTNMNNISNVATAGGNGSSSASTKQRSRTMSFGGAAASSLFNPMTMSSSPSNASMTRNLHSNSFSEIENNNSFYENSLNKSFNSTNNTLPTEQQSFKLTENSSSTTQTNSNPNINANGSTSSTGGTGGTGTGSSINRAGVNLEEEYRVNLTLLQCFTILNGVQTNDTNQKIIESLMTRSKETSRLYENSAQ